MKKMILGIAIAAVVLYLWGFLYWGLGPYRQMIWKQSADDVAAGEALLRHFPENGTYYVPGFGHEEEEIESLFQQGPVAFVHILSVNGRPLADPSIMIWGFVLNLVGIVLIALFLHRLGSALPSYGDRVRFVILIGLTAAL